MDEAAQGKGRRVFCYKKKCSLRLIIDIGRTNQRFQPPPGVSLSSAEAFAQIESSEDCIVFCSTVDVQNCFRHMRIEPEMNAYFALPGIPAGRMGVSEVDGGPSG